MPELPTVDQIRIFISSPGDVVAERDALEDLIKNTLQTRHGDRLSVHMEPRRWETHGRPGLGDIQTNLFDQIGEYHIYIGIFWLRFGTPTGNHESGSEAEFYDAYARWQADNSRPVMLYFCEREDNFSLKSHTMKELIERKEQQEKVEAFRENVGKEGLFWTYTDLADFTKKVERHLDATIEKIAGNKTPPPAPPPPRAVSSESRRHYLKALQSDCLQIPLDVLGDLKGFDKRAVTLDQVFISLDAFEKDPEQLKRGLEALEDTHRMTALEAVRDAGQLVLLGDPGSGKSSFVKLLLANLADTELDGAEPLLPDTGGLLPALVLLRDLAALLAHEKLPADTLSRRRFLAGKIADLAAEQARTLLVPEFVDGVKQAFVERRVFLVLDGMDEVPYEQRKLVREAVGAALNQFQLKRVFVTCRVRSYSGESVFDEVPTYTLARLGKEQIQAFAEQWYRAQQKLQRVKADGVDARIADLQDVATRAPLLSLAENPMLLTTMTIIHQQQKKLPEERVLLYNLAVELLLKRWQEGRAGVSTELSAFLAEKQARMRTVMERLAYEAHLARVADKAADLPRASTIELLSDKAYFGHESLATQFLDYVDQRAGLLIGRGENAVRPASYGFPHRTFQEYLAGCYVIGERGAADRLRLLARFGEYWSEAVIQGIEELAINRKNKNSILNLATQLSREAGGSERDERLILWASQMAKIVGREEVAQDPGDMEKGEVLLHRLQHQLVGVLGGKLPPIERAEAGRVLAALGDPRPEVMTIEGMRFCFVPAGPFLMGDDKREINVPYDYWIGQYPVTNAQFASFTKDGGYGTRQWWTDAGWEFIKNSGRTAPYPYRAPFGLLNHPVVGVSWYEALAYVTWFTEQARLQKWIPPGGAIVLPNEPEWEKAARGGLELQEVMIHAFPLSTLSNDTSKSGLVANTNSGRMYPWGDKIAPGDCNYGETKIGSTSTTGCFAKDASPYAVREMAGNVSEWSRTVNTKADYDKHVSKWKDSEMLTDNASRVLRGGSFDGGAEGVRCARRNGSDPDYVNLDIGFRVVFAPP
ncbi:MAG: SUMF1/EgtB/PvdO family nonheme iron enzyme [Rhodothermales bacterium]|nr:SUMF1/EgtB/PvdO family nonheme iron enzyme [Rhodothermales bacterium]